MKQASILCAILDSAHDARLEDRAAPVIVTDRATGRHLAAALAKEIGCRPSELEGPGAIAMFDGVKIMESA